MARNYTELEVQTIAENLIGKTFGEINNYKVNSQEFNKGSFGHIIEKDVFDYDINSFSEPDFVEAEIELKVTPYKINKNKTLSAKERLVLNIINYMEEYTNEFYQSHFWYKNKKIQIVWYLYEEGKAKNDLRITHQKLFEFPEEDLIIIKKDWENIINKIKQGKAEEISEGDTMYLGACTKGANSNSLRQQPFSNVMAMQRAFCLKTSYMTQLVRTYIGNIQDVEKILNNTKVSFEEYVNNIVSKYKNKSQEELMKELNISSNAKDLNMLLVSRMFGIKGKLSETDEFLKANIIPRTIRIEENGYIKESMPFPAFKYKELIREEWEDSDFRNELESTKYMFFVFRKENGKYVFKDIKLWNVPELIINEEAYKVWKETKDVIEKGNIVKEVIDGKRITNFPGSSFNKYFHTRPHARDAKDTNELPVPDKLTGLRDYTKYCFWINNTYLMKILE